MNFTVEWRVEVPRVLVPGLHDVRTIATLYDAPSDERASLIVWQDGSYMISYGEGIRHLYEDAAFDLKSLLDEFHKRIMDEGGWCDWKWAE